MIGHEDEFVWVYEQSPYNVQLSGPAVGCCWPSFWFRRVIDCRLWATALVAFGSLLGSCQI